MLVVKDSPHPSNIAAWWYLQDAPHDHVLLRFGWNSLLDFDIQKNLITPVKIPDAEPGAVYSIDTVVRDTGNNHSVVFYCRDSNYPSKVSGLCCYDVLTGENRWTGKDLPRVSEYPIIGGRFVFFEGTDNPRAGKRLVTSPLDPIATKSDDPKGKNVQVLRKFTYNLWHWYELYQVSPCKRYAVITRHLQSYRGSPDLYYIVDVTTGEKWELAKVVPRSEKAYVSPITWVEKAKE